MVMNKSYSAYLKRYDKSQRTSMSRSRLSPKAFEAAQKRYHTVVKGNHFNADYEDYVRLKKALCLDVPS